MTLRDRLFYWPYTRWYNHRKAGHRIRRALYALLVDITVTEIWRDQWRNGWRAS